MEGHRSRHNEPGIRALCARLVRLQVALVALERPDGLLIERLLDAGLLVVEQGRLAEHGLHEELMRGQ